MSTFEDGLAKRKQVMGAEHVEKVMETAGAFDQDIQRLATEYAWGEVWTRTALTDRERSLINLGMIAALNRQTELKGHVKGALRNGVTEEEIRDVMLQIAVYCGMPTGLDSQRTAKAAIAEFTAERDAAGAR